MIAPYPELRIIRARDPLDMIDSDGGDVMAESKATQAPRKGLQERLGVLLPLPAIAALASIGPTFRAAVNSEACGARPVPSRCVWHQRNL
tara:strand:- start:5337 stop:5606 length:270 start_codon:yes stop_codon:yes gene_type:complete